MMSNKGKPFKALCLTIFLILWCNTTSAPLKPSVSPGAPVWSNYDQVLHLQTLEEIVSISEKLVKQAKVEMQLYTDLLRIIAPDSCERAIKIKAMR